MSDEISDKHIRYECLKIAESFCGWNFRSANDVLTTAAKYWRFVESGTALTVVETSQEDTAA